MRDYHEDLHDKKISGDPRGKLTAADLVRVVGAVHVVVTLLVFPDALPVGTGELVWRTPNLGRKTRHHPFIRLESITATVSLFVSPMERDLCSVEDLR